MGMKLGMCGFTIGAAAYYRQFPVVEVQQTFYDPPPMATIEKWRAQAPADFEFTMKAWQVITHFGTSSTYRREPRGPWPDDLVLALCRQLDLVHAVDPFVRPSLTPELLYWRLHGNRSHYARYTDEELLQIIDWVPVDDATECYVLFNNIPRVRDVRRFRELLVDPDSPAEGP
jgi:uncharacterized protein YecE (DUF72 family)